MKVGIKIQSFYEDKIPMYLNGADNEEAILIKFYFNGFVGKCYNFQQHFLIKR